MVGDPYVYQGTHTLKNIHNERESEVLDKIERQVSAVRTATARQLDFPATVEGFRALHKHLFQDTYEWAGHCRTINMSKDAALFVPSKHIAFELDKRFAAFNRAAAPNSSPDHFFERLGEHITELNIIHPFREGNGRTMRAHAEGMARAAGLAIDPAKIDQGRWMMASKVGFQTADFREMASLLWDAQIMPTREKINHQDAALPRTDAHKIDRSVYFLERENPALADEFIKANRTAFRSALAERRASRSQEPSPAEQLAQKFRDASQSERLADPRLNAVAKVLAVANAHIDAAHQPGSQENQKAKDIAVNVLAANIAKGRVYDAPKVLRTAPGRANEIKIPDKSRERTPDR